MSNQKSAVVRKICLAYIDGLSMQQIAKGLNAKHTPCFGGGIRWTQGQVAPQLRSELARKVLTDKEFAALQIKLSQNKGRKGGTKSRWHSNLFPNRVRCAACGASVTTHNTKGGKGKPLRYFRCKCQLGGLPIAKIEKDFFLSFLPGLTGMEKERADIQQALGNLVEQALENPEVRSRLVQLLPNLVTCLTIDWESGSYSITTTDGKTTPIRNVVAIHVPSNPEWEAVQEKAAKALKKDGGFVFHNVYRSQ